MKPIHKVSILIAILCFSLNLPAQKKADVIMQGTVTSAEDGYPIIGANVSEIDENNRVVNGTITDFNGHYVIKVKNDKNSLNFSYIGYHKKSVKITSNRVLNIALNENTQNIRTVEVVAERKYGEGGFSIPKREISTAIQTLDMKEMEGLQVSSVDEALQGRIAGLDIVANSGDPGSGSSMRIRGASSINGSNQPLIVLNGVPYDMQVDQNFDYANSNQEQFANLLSINPDDISEISVLKDAAASAIWGSKGANGVIMITTRKGASGPTKVQYSFRYTGTVQPRGRLMLNGDDYTMLMKQEFFNPAQDSHASNYPEYNYDPTFLQYENYNNNTDWVKEVTQIGNISDHYLTFSGGGERATYRISGGYLSQNGTIIGQENSRISNRSYVEYKVSDRIKFIAELSYTYSNYNRSYNFDFSGGNTPNRGDSPNEDLSILGIAYIKMPNISVFKQDAQGNDTRNYFVTPESSGLNWDQKYLVNPVALALKARNNVRNYRTLPTFRLQYDLLNPEDQMLRYNMYVSFDINNDITSRFLPSELTNYNWSNHHFNRSDTGDNEAVTIQTDNNLAWMPKFTNEDHSLLLYGSLQTTEGRSNYQGIVSYGLISKYADDPSNQAYLSSEYTSRAHWRSMGIMARMHYAYKGRYILDGTFRRDGSTKFGKGNKWGNFPGVSLKWIVSDEPFLENASWLNMLALRPGWGIAGNQPGNEYLHFSRYGQDGSYAGLPVQIPVSLQLKDLKWETTTSLNYGMDLGLFNDKIQVDFNYYNKRTRDLLFPNVGIPNSSGFNSLTFQNVGSMNNDGWEVNVYANKVIESGDFSVDLRANFANSVNKIIQMDEKILNTFNGDYNYQNGSYLTRIQEGNSFGSIYGFRYNGVYQYDEYIAGIQEDAPVARDEFNNVIVDEKNKPLPMFFNYARKNGGPQYEFRGGDAKYEDINHDGNIDDLDIVYLGNSNPVLNGGFGATLRYKQLSCNMAFNFRYGNEIVNAARMYAENMYSTNNQSTVVNWRWRKEGDITSIPRALYSYGYNWLGSDRFVEDGSFLRLKYLTFNYSLPKEMVRKVKMDKVSLYMTLNNIFVLTKYSGVDPEVGYGSFGVSMDWAQTPRSRDLTFGLTVGF